MNPGRFYMPRMGNGIGPIIGNSFNPMINGSGLPSRGMGLFGRIGNSLRTFNWSGLLSGANKTLNVVNQTIPLVRQAKPMFNNMRSMLKIAKAFGSETFSSKNSNNNSSINSVSNNHNKSTTDYKQSMVIKKEVQSDNTPSFFV